MKWEFKEPRRGDIVRAKVKFYYHYGVFVGDGQVVAFGMPDNTGVDPEAIEVIATDAATFMHGSALETAVLSLTERRQRRSADQTVEYARSQLGRRGYNILHNNCAHFANECVFGEGKSGFVDSVREEIRKKLHGGE